MLGALVIWGLLHAGPAASLDAGGSVYLTAGGSAPLPSDLLNATMRMEQARQAERWQTEKFETDLRCRRDPDQCPPLFEVAPPQRDPARDVLIPDREQEPAPSSKPAPE
jgi:hypothetical protein